MHKVTENIFPLEWRLSDPLVVPYHGKKVFGTFVCGGGSTMGYKLAGYDHLGGVEFVDYYASMYRKNHNPRYMYEQDIREFNKRHDLPEELYHLDLLDGSPPCAAFSTAGSREDVWGKKSQYENTQQQKDDLVFVYCDTILKLKPKVFLLENVSGLAKGNARSYLKRVVAKLSGEYDVQVFLLYAASMGIPQLRNRIFVIGKRKEFAHIPKLVLDFACPPTTFGLTRKYWDIEDSKNWDISDKPVGRFWDETPIGKSHPKRFNFCKADPDKPCPTIFATQAKLGAACISHPFQKRALNVEEVRLCCTFPKDYDFCESKPINVMGRSVLPVMMANISHQIFLQWLAKM